MTRLIGQTCRHNRWEARIAAGKCLDDMMNTFTTSQPLPYAGATPPSIHSLKFPLDFEALMEKKVRFLGSAGKEYDVDTANMTPEQSLQARKETLKRLGLDDLDEKVLEELDRDSSSAPTREPSPTVVVVADEPDNPNLSAREKARLKRLQKQGKLTKPVAPKEETKPKEEKVVVQAKKKEDASSFVTSIKAVLTILSDHLFDAKWEVRHGACVALKSVLNWWRPLIRTF